MQFLSVPIKDATTGTVIVLTTPDAQRTMLAYQVQFTANEEYYYHTFLPLSCCDLRIPLQDVFKEIC